MDVIDNASYYIKEKLKIKVAKWGTPKKVFKNINSVRSRRLNAKPVDNIDISLIFVRGVK
jgi:hypothetical protein